MTEHPCAGRSQVAIETFEAIAINQPPPHGGRTLKSLLRAGLVEVVSTTVIGHDIWPIELPNYGVPLPIRYQWYQWAAEHVSADHEQLVSQD